MIDIVKIKSKGCCFFWCVPYAIGWRYDIFLSCYNGTLACCFFFCVSL